MSELNNMYKHQLVINIIYTKNDSIICCYNLEKTPSENKN